MSIGMFWTIFLALDICLRFVRELIREEPRFSRLLVGAMEIIAMGYIFSM